jgi:hypothetical protein
MLLIGGVVTEDSADPDLIVSFGVCLVVCPLPAELFDNFLYLLSCLISSL